MRLKEKPIMGQCLYQLAPSEYAQVSAYLQSIGQFVCSCPFCTYASRRVSAKRERVYESPLFVKSIRKLRPHQHQFKRDGDIKVCSCGEVLDYPDW